ncbi:MAG: hypothetical protein IT539_10740 [Bradyrhizobiaceae bacterium]|nr:hypothetical protein [Bradyrhizobiaceae bacterium]
MRLLFGIVLGAALTVGAAYYHDTTYISPSSAEPVRPIVNWDVAAEVAGKAADALRNQFERLIGR